MLRRSIAALLALLAAPAGSYAVAGGARGGMFVRAPTAAMCDYAQRASMFGLATKEEVAVLAAQPGVVWLDIRTEPEVGAAPLPIASVNLPCTKVDYSSIDARASEALPDKDATILAFCGIGLRVQNAKARLEEMGYRNVINVGGYNDIISLF